MLTKRFRVAQGPSSRLDWSPSDVSPAVTGTLQEWEELRVPATQHVALPESSGGVGGFGGTEALSPWGMGLVCPGLRDQTLLLGDPQPPADFSPSPSSHWVLSVPLTLNTDVRIPVPRSSGAVPWAGASDSEQDWLWGWDGLAWGGVAGLQGNRGGAGGRPCMGKPLSPGRGCPCVWGEPGVCTHWLTEKRREKKQRRGRVGEAVTLRTWGPGGSGAECYRQSGRCMIHTVLRSAHSPRISGSTHRPQIRAHSPRISRPECRQMCPYYLLICKRLTFQEPKFQCAVYALEKVEGSGPGHL